MSMNLQRLALLKALVEYLEKTDDECSIEEEGRINGCNSIGEFEGFAQLRADEHENGAKALEEVFTMPLHELAQTILNDVEFPSTEKSKD